jgi:hypothetical protein
MVDFARRGGDWQEALTESVQHALKMALDAEDQMIEPVETGDGYQRSVCANPLAQRESTDSGFGAGVDDDISGMGAPGETMRTTGIVKLVLPTKANHPKGCHAEQLA